MIHIDEKDSRISLFQLPCLTPEGHCYCIACNKMCRLDQTFLVSGYDFCEFCYDTCLPPNLPHNDTCPSSHD